MRWSDATGRPTDRQLCEFAGCGAAALAVLAIWHLLASGSLVRTGAYAAAAIAIALVGTLRPRWLAPLFTAWLVLVFPIAWLVSMLVLWLIYFGLFAPLALVFRILGRDALDRRLDKDQDSYWQKKPAAKEVRQYLRQY